MSPAPSRFNLILSRLKGDRAAVALLVAVFFAVNWRLLTGSVSEHWDGEDQFAPYFSYLSRLSRSGHLMLWNPFSSGGSPDFAEPQYGAFSPVTLLFGLIAGPGPTAFHFYWLSIWLLGGLGMYVLARALSAPPWGALLTSLGFVFSGYYLGHAEHISLVYSYSFVPWILWRVRAAMTSGRVWPACEAGALWGLSALAGNPAVVIPAALFMGVIALAWLPARPGISWQMRGRDYAVTMLLLAVVGTMVLAPSYLGFRHEVAGFSDRSQPLPRGETLPSQSLGYLWLSSMISPMIPLGSYQSPGWPELDICYLPVYFGAAIPVLAVFALWQRRSRWWKWAVAGAGLLFLGFTLGSALPLRGWLYDLLPPTRYIRHPPMFRGFFILAAAMLAASGSAIVDKRARQPEGQGNRLRPLALVAGGLAALSVVVYVWIFSTLPAVLGAPKLPMASLHLAFAWVGLAAVCLAAVRWPVVRRKLPLALAALAVGDLSGAYFLSGAVVYQQAPSRPDINPTLPLLELGADGFARAIVANANKNLYVQRPVFISYTAMTNRIYADWGKDSLLLSKAVGPKRLWFAAEASTVPATAEAYAAFRRRVHELNGLIIVRHERAALLQSGGAGLPAGMLDAINAAPLAEPLVWRLHHYRANDISLSVTCPRAGFLLLTDRWSRSWTATVNGQPAPVDGGDFLFRLVPVVAGDNLIEMKFELSWLYPLIILSWTTLGAIAAGSGWLWRRSSPWSRHRPHPQAAIPCKATAADCLTSV